ncbi:MAG: hypothetical protein AB7I06_06780 [Burkholderiales bacterium]
MRDDWNVAKEFFERTWNDYESFADDNFASELQTKFSERAWEIFLFDLLRMSGLQPTLQSRDMPNPDFKIDLGERNLFVEAVNAGQGKDHNRVETISDLLAHAPPGEVVGLTRSFDQGNHPKVRRITSSLKEKMQNYTATHKSVISDDDCYVIALNAGDIEGNMASSPEALILEAVKGIDPAIHIPRKGDGFGPAFHTTRFSIPNSRSTGVIDLDMFSEIEFKEISGVIYFGRDVINALLQDIQPSEAIFVHNPNVLEGKALPMDVFSHFTQITISPTEWTRHAAKI